MIRKGSWRFSSSNDPFNPTNFPAWIWSHSLILHCCHSKHLFFSFLSLSLCISISFFSLLSFSLSSALSLSTAEGGWLEETREIFRIFKRILFLGGDLNWVYGFWEGKSAVLVTHEVVLPWLGTEIQKWGVLLPAMWVTNRRGSIKFGGEATWDSISTSVLNLYSCLTTGFWWWWWRWLHCVWSQFNLCLNCCTCLSMLQLCFVGFSFLLNRWLLGHVSIIFLVVDHSPFVAW